MISRDGTRPTVPRGSPARSPARKWTSILIRLTLLCSLSHPPALLADEVGLGKTIEAGLVISQRWAERKRRILIITPSNLRKQWHQELSEKFFLSCAILESKSYNQAIKGGNFRPLDLDGTVVICS